MNDTGPGIPPERQQQVFDRFYRGSHHRGEDGAGLGLAIAKWAVEANGGELVYESAVGGGSRFLVRLPHARVPTDVPAVAGAA